MIWIGHHAWKWEGALAGVLEVRRALYALGLVKRITLILILEKRGSVWIGLPQDRSKHRDLV